MTYLNDDGLITFLINSLKNNPSFAQRTINANAITSSTVNTQFERDLDLMDIKDEGRLNSYPLVTMFIDSENDDNDEDISHLPTVCKKTTLVMQISYPNLKRDQALKECKSFCEEIFDFINNNYEFQVTVPAEISLLKAKQIKRLTSQKHSDSTYLGFYRISFLIQRS